MKAVDGRLARREVEKNASRHQIIGLIVYLL